MKPEKHLQVIFREPLSETKVKDKLVLNENGTFYYRRRFDVKGLTIDRILLIRKF